jgi:hypothetical protein
MQIIFRNKSEKVQVANRKSKNDADKKHVFIYKNTVRITLYQLRQSQAHEPLRGAIEKNGWNVTVEPEDIGYDNRRYPKIFRGYLKL